MGITPDDVQHLSPFGVRKLVGWAERDMSWELVLLCAFAAVVYGAFPSLVFDLPWPLAFVFVWLALAGVFFPILVFASVALFRMLGPSFNLYRAYGQAGYEVLRVLQKVEPYSLAQKTAAIRAAHAWRRLGKPRGVDVEERTRRVFQLLGNYPMDQATATEICDLVRAALVETAGGKVAPETFREPRSMWQEHMKLELANRRMTLIAVTVGIPVTVMAFLLGR